VKNILYISAFSHIGGGEISLLLLLKNLDHQMVRPFLICYSEGPFVQKAKALGIKTVIFKRNYPFASVVIVLKIFSFLKKNSINLVHVNSLDIRAGIVAWLARVPFIGHLRVIFPFTWRDRLFVQLSNRTIAVSNAVMNAFCKKRSSYRDKFIVIPNATEIPRNLTSAPLRKEFRLPKDSKLIGAVGRIDPCKGYEFFLESAAIIKKQWEKVFFFIVGDVVPGDSEGKYYLDILRRKTAELNLQNCLFFTGYREDISKIIKSLDILVIPSIVLKKNRVEITEGFGRVAIEAMAVEMPVVATNTGGLPEIVEDNINGMLVPPGDPYAITQAVIMILNDPVKARTLGKAGRKRVKEIFSIERNIGETEKIYFDILKNK
jgi:glycosyltransferase involved in cell wall biosynthesis